MWGEATVTNQYEGAWQVDGKGNPISDHCTNGSKDNSRRITINFEEGSHHSSLLVDYYYS